MNIALPSMELLLSLAIGLVSATGVYLLLRGRSWPVILGLGVLSYAVNVFIFVMGRLWYKASAIIQTPDGQFADPLPQALVLTAIVIGFATTGFVIELAIRSRQESGSDHVDGHEPGHSVAYTVEHKDDAPLQKAAMDNNKLKDGAA